MRDWSIRRYFIIGIVLAMAITVLFRFLDDKWREAVTASSTVVLVLVTAVYAAFTRKLVSVTERQDPAHAVHTDTAARLLRVANPHEQVRRIESLVEDWEDVGSDDAEAQLSLLEKLAEETKDLYQHLRREAFLVPLPLGISCQEAVSALQDAMISTLVLTISIREAQNAAFNSEMAYDLDQAKAVYYSKHRDELEDRPEWEEVVEFKAHTDALERLESLVKALHRFLNAPST